jgi:hypothetical protein
MALTTNERRSGSIPSADHQGEPHRVTVDVNALMGHDADPPFKIRS